MILINRIRKRVRIKMLQWKGLKAANGAQVFNGVEIVNPQNMSIGQNGILYKNSTFYIGTTGSFRIGTNSHIAPFGYFLVDKNKIDIGDHVAVGPFCTFICHSNAVEGPSEYFSKNYLDGDIVIGNNVFIGAQCTILPGTIIEDNVVVASNSVVKGHLERNWVYGGTPVKQLRKIE